MRKNRSQKAYRPGPYLLSAVFFAFLLGLGAFLVNEVVFFNEGFPLTRMNDVEFYATFALYLLAFVSYLAFGKHRFRYAEPWWLDVLLLCFFLCGSIGIFAYPSETLLPNGYTFIVDLPNKMRSFCCLLTSVCSLYACLGIGPRTTRGGKFSLFAATVVLIIALSGVVYSGIAEREVFAHFFHSTGNMADKVLQSFTNNRNTFGTLLLFGIGAAALWNAHRPSFIWYLLMGLFAFTLCFVLSKTSIILSAAFLLCYLLYRFLATFKSHPVRNGLWMAAFLGAAIVFGLATFTTAFDPIAPEFTFFMHNFLASISKYGTFGARMDIWELCFAELNTPIKLLFGIGYRNVNAFLYASHFAAVGYSDWTHNGFVDLLMRNGLIGMLLSGGIVIAFLAYLSLTFRKENNLAVTFALLAIFFGGHGMTETTDFFAMDAKSIFLVLMTLYPAFSDFYWERYGIKEKDREHYSSILLPKKVRYVLSPIRIATRCFVYLFVPLICVSAVLMPLGRHFELPYLISPPLSLSLLALYLILPYLFYSLSFLPKGKRFLNGVVPMLLCLSSVPLALFPQGYYASIPPLCALFGVYFRTKRLKEGFDGHLFSKAYLPFSLCALLSFLLPHGLDFFYASSHSLFLALPCFLAPLCLFFLFFEGTKWHLSAYVPFAYREERFESRIHFRSEAFDLRCRQRRFLDSLTPKQRKAEKKRFKKDRTYLFSFPS